MRTFIVLPKRGRRAKASRGWMPAATAMALLAGTAAAVTVPVGNASAAPGTPAFVQQVSAHGSGKSSIAVTTGASVTAGDRLVIEVGTWNSKSATTSSVTDSLSDSFVEVTHFTAADGAEMSIWTAPIASGGGTDTITAKPTSAADMAVIALEYSGLSTVADITAVDQVSHSVGTTTTAATVQSTATPPTAAANELAVGFYADSGFGDALAAGSGYAVRSDVAPASDMEMLAEDQSLPAAGATPAASVQTGAKTPWLMATVVFGSSAAGPTGSPDTGRGESR